MGTLFSLGDFVRVQWPVMSHYQALPLEAPVRAEVYEDADLQAGGFQVVEKLRLLATCESVDRFNFDQDRAVTNKVRTIRLFQHPSLVPNRELLLRIERNSPLVQLQ